MFNTLLVPVDFSPASDQACARAMQLVSGDDPVVLVLHVLDPNLVRFAAAHDLGSAEEITRRMRERAEVEMSRHEEMAPEGTEVDLIVSEGTPFIEILRKSEDFVVDAIVMAKVGVRGKLEKLLFGSTAEKVLRGSRRPVLVLPSDS